MKTPRMLRSLLTAAVVAALPISLANAQDRFANVEVKATAIKGAVHMLTGAGGNIGVSAGDDGVLIIDDQFAPLAEKIAANPVFLNFGDSLNVLGINSYIFFQSSICFILSLICFIPSCVVMTGSLGILIF